jgi:hypothetical protein
MKRDLARKETEFVEQQIRRWGSRPAKTPAPVAAARVLARLSRHTAAAAARPGLRWGVPLASAAALCAIWLLIRPAATPERKTRAVVEVSPVVCDITYEVDPEYVLQWVNPHTPVYFRLRPITLQRGEPR